LHSRCLTSAPWEIFQQGNIEYREVRANPKPKGHGDQGHGHNDPAIVDAPKIGRPLVQPYSSLFASSGKPLACLRSSNRAIGFNVVFNGINLTLHFSSMFFFPS